MSTADPFDVGFEYVVTDKKPEESENRPNQVEGIFRQIEEAAQQQLGVHQNSHISFAGMLCPVICEEESRVKILHGHTEIWIDRVHAAKVLNSKTRERAPGWNDVSTNPLLQPHRP